MEGSRGGTADRGGCWFLLPLFTCLPPPPPIPYLPQCRRRKRDFPQLCIELVGGAEAAETNQSPFPSFPPILYRHHRSSTFGPKPQLSPYPTLPSDLSCTVEKEGKED